MVTDRSIFPNSGGLGAQRDSCVVDVPGIDNSQINGKNGRVPDGPGPVLPPGSKCSTPNLLTSSFSK